MQIRESLNTQFQIGLNLDFFLSESNNLLGISWILSHNVYIHTQNNFSI